MLYLRVKSMSKSTIYFFLMFPLILSCNKDDDNTVEIRDRSDQVVLDEQTIEEYLRTHYYNYEDFSNPNSFEVDMKVRIDTITDSTSDRTPLFDQVNIKTINVADSDGLSSLAIKEIRFTPVSILISSSKERIFSLNDSEFAIKTVALFLGGIFN